MAAPIGNINAAKNRRIRRELLREELRSREYLRQIEKILAIANWGGRTAEYKAKIDSYLALLRKTLPDLKAVELTGDTARPISYVSAKPEALTPAQWEAKYAPREDPKLN